MNIQEGAFDEAVKGVDAILHTASPVILKADDPEGASSFPTKEWIVNISFDQN